MCGRREQDDGAWRGVRLRDADRRDEAAVVRMLAAAERWAHASTGAPAGPGDFQSLAYALPEGATADQKRLLVVCDGDEVVGVVDAVVDWPEPGTVAIGVFLVDPVLHRRGIGSAALEVGCRAARRAGARRIRASCPAGWAEGEGFLRRSGFRRLDPAPVVMNRVVHPHEDERRIDPWLLEI
ncbi:GNAT family N-acetyltransferase [Amnibacterium endophyticum]|uniref:GNAT family N-acetyltransferase n=1 Tax=Amnibacterium endophyticum TaxID=2109337 RepID=A0ABW4L9M0_9MICO